MPIAPTRGGEIMGFGIRRDRWEFDSRSRGRSEGTNSGVCGARRATRRSRETPRVGGMIGSMDRRHAMECDKDNGRVRNLDRRPDSTEVRWRSKSRESRSPLPVRSCTDISTETTARATVPEGYRPGAMARHSRSFVAVDRRSARRVSPGWMRERLARTHSSRAMALAAATEPDGKLTRTETSTFPVRVPIPSYRYYGPTCHR